MYLYVSDHQPEMLGLTLPLALSITPSMRKWPKSLRHPRIVRIIGQFGSLPFGWLKNSDLPQKIMLWLFHTFFVRFHLWLSRKINSIWFVQFHFQYFPRFQPSDLFDFWSSDHQILFGCVWKCCVPHCTQWFDHYSYEKWLFHWEYLPNITQHFQTNPFDRPLSMSDILRSPVVLRPIFGPPPGCASCSNSHRSTESAGTLSSPITWQLRTVAAGGDQNYPLVN